MESTALASYDKSDFDEYQKFAMRTAKDFGSYQMNLTHAALGISSDAGELVDAIKKHVIYGKPLDRPNVIEEIGDCLWFLTLAADCLGIRLQHCANENIEKLKKRYPEKYSDEAAIARADKAGEEGNG